MSGRNTNPELSKRDQRKENKTAKREAIEQTRLQKIEAKEKEVRDIVNDEISKIAPTPTESNIEAAPLIKGESYNPKYKSFSSDLKSLSDKYRPSYESTVVSGKDRETAEDLMAKQKKRKWLDYVSAIGSGVSGQSFDPKKLPTQILKERRKEIYRPYMEAAERNRKAKDAFELRQYNEQMGVLKDAFKNAESTEDQEALKLKMENLRLQNKSVEARIRATDRSNQTKSTAAKSEKVDYEQQAVEMGVTDEQLRNLVASQYDDITPGKASSTLIKNAARDFVLSGNQDIDEMIQSKLTARRSKQIDDEIKYKKELIKEQEEAKKGGLGWRDSDERKAIEGYEAEIAELEAEKENLSPKEIATPVKDEEITQHTPDELIEKVEGKKELSDQDRIEDW